MNPSCWVFVKLRVIPLVDYYGEILEVMIFMALGEIGGGGLSAFNLSSLYISTIVAGMEEGIFSALEEESLLGPFLRRLNVCGCRPSGAAESLCLDLGGLGGELGCCSSGSPPFKLFNFLS